MGVTGWLNIEHGHTVRFLDGRIGTVKMCVAGGVVANVFICFSVNCVAVRLFFTAGGIGDPRVVLFFRFSVGSARRGPPCWRPGVLWLLSVSLRLLAR